LVDVVPQDIDDVRYVPVNGTEIDLCGTTPIGSGDDVLVGIFVHEGLCDLDNHALLSYVFFGTCSEEVVEEFCFGVLCPTCLDTLDDLEGNSDRRVG
jgi:hypothetical protein